MSNKMSVINQIRSAYPNLTKTEQKLGQYILDNVEDVTNQSLTIMSQNSGVGEATIMRFIYKVGFSSLAKFKLAIARDIVLNHTQMDYGDSSEDYAKRIYDCMVESIKANSNESLKKAAEIIENASFVHFFGNGTSGYAATTAAYRFFRAGVACEAVTDAHLMRMRSVILKEDEVVIAISLSGDNIDLNKTVEYAKDTGCKVITICGHKLSKLSKLGDLNLYHCPTDLREKSYYGGMQAIIVQEFLMDLIFKEYEARNEDTVEYYHSQTTEASNLQHESLCNEKNYY